ncbi:MAG: low molecular weight protein-tyrosine-phosphatase, partial [Acidobacteriota bacterium]
MTAATPPPEPLTPSVLFVCLGNICRSPTGEAVFRAYAEAEGPTPVRVDSAGTSGYHAGEPADARMRQAGARRGYSLESRSRQTVADDFHSFDLIVAMDRNNLRDLRSQAPSDATAEVRLLSDFLEPGAPVDVPDPYYG